MKYNLVIELKEEIVLCVKDGKGTVKRLKQHILHQLN